MNYKKIIIISILLLVLSVAAVSASDLDNNYVTESSDADDSLSIEDSFAESAQIQDSEILTDSAGTFEELQAQIDNAHAGSVLNLTRDYNGHKGAMVNLNKDLTINGQGHTIDCLGSDCIAFYSSSGNIVLKNLKIINGYNDVSSSGNHEIIIRETYLNTAGDIDDLNGGAIRIEGSAQYTIESCTFNNNWADDDGGAIYNGANQPLKIINCQFTSNEVDDGNGGAIYSVGALFVENSIFNGNIADDNGGAIYTEQTLTVKNCQFYNNKADDDDGGAVYSKGDVTIADSTFDSNNAYVSGGAVYSEKTVNVDKCLFKSNMAYGALLYHCDGGAIFAAGDVTVNNCTFMYNSAENDGGAIYSRKNIYINNNQGVRDYNSFFISNTASGSNSHECRGGAVYANNKAYVKNALFSQNQAGSYSGAVYGSAIDVNHCLFELNYANDNGGAVGHLGSIVNVDNCIFWNNCAYYTGGAVKADSVTINNSTFENNTAGDSGGAVYTVRLTIKHTPSYFINNIANDRHVGNGGGAIFTSYINGDIKYATFKDNLAGGRTLTHSHDGGAVYVEGETAAVFSNCVFISNKASDEGGAIYLDDDDSGVSLINNVFIGNSAGEGKSVYTCGKFNEIRNNIWKTTPATSNDQLIEWMPFSSNVHHVDSDPLKIDLVLSSSTCLVGDTVTATLRFLKSDGSVFTGEMFDNNQVSFSPYPDVDIENEDVGRNKVSVDLIPRDKGMYTVFCGFYTITTFKEFNVYTLDIIAPEVTTFTNVPVTFKVHLEGDKEVTANQDVRVSFFKHYYLVTDENGDANVTFYDDLNREEGSYLVEVLCNGVNAKSALNIVTTIFAEDVVQIYGDHVEFKAQFTNNSGNFLKKSTQVQFLLDGNPCYSVINDNEGNALADFYSVSRGEHKVVVVNPDNGESKIYRIVILMGFGGTNNGTNNQNQETPDDNNGNALNGNAVNGNATEVNSLTGDLYYGNSISDDNGISNDNGNATNQSANSPVSKAIENPQANGGDNNLWWIILAIIAVIAAGGIIKKYKS